MTARTAERYQSAQQAATARINQIQAELDQMQRLVNQEKADHGKHDWADVGSLAHIAEQLSQTTAFWTNSED